MTKKTNASAFNRLKSGSIPISSPIPPKWSEHTAAVRTAARPRIWYFIYDFQTTAQCDVMWCYVQTAAWLQPEPQPEPHPEPQPDRSSLYINNGDVMQTTVVQTAAVCLGHTNCVRCSTIEIQFKWFNITEIKLCGSIPRMKSSILSRIYSQWEFLKPSIGYFSPHSTIKSNLPYLRKSLP